MNGGHRRKNIGHGLGNGSSRGPPRGGLIEDNVEKRPGYGLRTAPRGQEVLTGKTGIGGESPYGLNFSRGPLTFFTYLQTKSLIAKADPLSLIGIGGPKRTQRKHKTPNRPEVIGLQADKLPLFDAEMHSGGNI